MIDQKGHPNFISYMLNFSTDTTLNDEAKKTDEEEKKKVNYPELHMHHGWEEKHSSLTYYTTPTNFTDNNNPFEEWKFISNEFVNELPSMCKDIVNEVVTQVEETMVYDPSINLWFPKSQTAFGVSKSNILL